MKKFLLIIFVAGIVYGAAWVAVAKIGEQTLAKTIKTESVTVTGFPQRFVATMEKPEITIGNALLTSNQSLQLSRNIAGSEYQFVLPRDITIHSNQNIVTCHFEQPANVHISVEPLVLEKQKYQDLQSLLKDPKFYAALRAAEYKDAGASCVNEKAKSHYTYTSGNFSLRNEKRENRGVLYYKAAMTGDVNLAMDVELDGYDPFLTNAFPENSELRINTLRVQSAGYTSDATGYVKVNKTDIFPYGLIKLNLQNITAILDAVYTTPMHLPERAKLNAFVLKLANAKPGDQNLAIQIIRPRGQNLQVGTMPLAQFLMSWNQLFANNDNSRTQ